MLSIFSVAYWPSAYIWRNIFLSLLLILKIGVWLHCKSSLYFLDINPVSDTWFANIFSHSLVVFFILLVVSFSAENFLILIKSNVSIFFSYCLCIWCHIQVINFSIYVFFQEGKSFCSFSSNI